MAEVARTNGVFFQLGHCGRTLARMIVYHVLPLYIITDKRARSRDAQKRCMYFLAGNVKS